MTSTNQRLVLSFTNLLKLRAHMETILPYFCHDCKTQVHLTIEMKCEICNGIFVEPYNSRSHMLFTARLGTILGILEELRRIELAEILLMARNHGFRSGSIIENIYNYATEEEIQLIAERLAEDQPGKKTRPFLNMRRIRNSKCREEGRCGICLDDYTAGEKGVYLKCKHFYHRPCIVKWLKIEGSCPNCRKVLE